MISIGDTIIMVVGTLNIVSLVFFPVLASHYKTEADKAAKAQQALQRDLNEAYSNLNKAYRDLEEADKIIDVYLGD
jgi:hypothetical protein